MTSPQGNDVSGDPRARIFMPLDAFERSLHGLDPQEKREARIAFVSDGLSLYADEVNWRRNLKPRLIVWRVIPLLWPILWYRGQFSKMYLSALSRAIDRCRQCWSDDLREAGMQLDHIVDPLEPK